ncbi:MAG TPA: hypothetical protein VGA15_02215 [Bradyrhizobium sp.]
MPKQKSVQQQSGDWAMTGKVPVARVEGLELLPATIGRMKPSGTSRPWQDRRTLIFQCDQRLAILRMVFLCRGFTPFVNP